MPDPPPTHSNNETPDLDGHEAAAGKMWAVYVAEAEKYDRGLVESWKSDMEGMLIFAGLFSAGLVAFLIESYKTLTPDSGDTTVLLLTRISNQLAAAANGTTFTTTPHTPFSPQISSLVCNTLWFISLGLSLTCALVATLIEQWAREFMHKADMRSAPIIRAGVFSYLYYGLKRFEMHAVVEITPLLLHTSLLFFFIGLVAFLIPVNIFITVIIGVLLFVLAAVYAVLTIFPLVYIDCPYRTPLSKALWKLNEKVRGTRRLPVAPLDVEIQVKPDSPETMVKAVFRKAGQQSDSQRSGREGDALSWTMKSLADDTELEPFIKAIPDVLWGPTARRRIYDKHIQRLIGDSNVKLLDRVQTLYKSCDTGLLTSDVSTRRKISCLQATWAIGTLATPDKPYNHGLFRDVVANAQQGDHYSISAAAISRWGLFCAARDVLRDVDGHLKACKAALTEEAEEHPNMMARQHKLLDSLKTLNSYSISLHYPKDVKTLASRMERLSEEFGNPSTTVPFRILLDYLTDASRLSSPPFRFEATRDCIAPVKSDVPLTQGWLKDLENRLDKIVDDGLHQMNTTEDVHWLDSIVHTMMGYWVPFETEQGPTLPDPFIRYLNMRNSEAAVEGAMNALQFAKIGDTFIPATIRRLIDTLSQHSSISKIQETEAERSLTDLWLFLRRVSLDISLSELIVDKVSRIGHPLMTPSVVAMAKYRVLTLLGTDRSPQKRRPARPRHPFLPAESAAAHLTEDIALEYRLYEGRLGILTDFIEACGQSSEELFKARETLVFLGTFIPGDIYQLATQIHPTHQLRFAQAVGSLFESSTHPDDWRVELLDAILTLRLFTAYAPEVETDRWASISVPPPRWLNSPEACRTLKDASEKYLDTLSSRNRDSSLIRYVQNIATILEHFASQAQVAPALVPYNNDSPRIVKAQEFLTELWARLCQPTLRFDVSWLEGIIEDLSHNDFPSTTPSVVAMTKYRVLTLLGSDRDSAESHYLLPTETVAAHLTVDVGFEYRLYEARLGILTDLIEACHQSSEPLFKARETLEILGAFIPGNMFRLATQIHPTHQLRFADAIGNLVKVSTPPGDWRIQVLDAIPRFTLFAGYELQPETDRWGPFLPPKWLNSPDASRILGDAFEKYLGTLSSRKSDPTLVLHVKNIIIVLRGGHTPGPEKPLLSVFNGEEHMQISSENISGQDVSFGMPATVVLPPISWSTHGMAYSYAISPNFNPAGMGPAMRMTQPPEETNIGWSQSQTQWGAQEVQERAEWWLGNDGESPMNSPVISRPYDGFLGPINMDMAPMRPTSPGRGDHVFLPNEGEVTPVVPNVEYEDEYHDGPEDTLETPSATAQSNPSAEYLGTLSKLGSPSSRGESNRTSANGDSPANGSVNSSGNADPDAPVGSRQPSTSSHQSELSYMGPST
ncbi:hypothetical protein DFH09DRAFT_402525 [Mycena vulgaris]|nr:hypothetical protein DFH09DRAFT_402525 [Mycena vulgaris]